MNSKCNGKNDKNDIVEKIIKDDITSTRDFFSLCTVWWKNNVFLNCASTNSKKKIIFLIIFGQVADEFSLCSQLIFDTNVFIEISSSRSFHNYQKKKKKKSWTPTKKSTWNSEKGVKQTSIKYFYKVFG